MLKLQITRYKKNENFTEELKEFKERSRYSMRNIDERFPEKEKLDKVLDVEVTEEQFEAIRKAVIEKF